MRARVLLVAATAWLAVVLVGSMVVWAVISRAGERIVPAPIEAAGATAPGGADTRSGDGRGPAGIGDPAATHEPPRRSSPSAPASSSAAPTTAPPTRSSAPASSSSAPVQHSSAPPPPQPALRSGSWSGAAGLVYAECRGARIVTVTAQADSGWSVQVEERGPEELSVKFRANNPEREVQVSGHCVGGSPHFQAEDSGSGGGDDADHE